ncbi:MAG: hypothetical protein AB8C95_05750 [Phycisphaeraceae bacterium]
MSLNMIFSRIPFYAIYIVTFLITSFAFTLECKCEQALQTTPSEQFGERLTSALEDMKSTKYQHKTEIDEDTKRYRCDCSGLLGYFLRQDHPEAYLALTGELAPWRSRPLTVTYYETFNRVGEDGDGLWVQIPSLLDAKPGDILAWRYSLLKKGKSTGHSMMIASKPVRERDGRIRVRVIDSTTYPHGNDTRQGDATGLGAGDIWFVIDKQGRPVAYHHREKSDRKDSRLIAIGRLQIGKVIAEVSHDDDRVFIGLPELKAKRLAKKLELRWRVIHRNKQPVRLTLSRETEARINVVIVDGKVVRVRRG